MILQFLRFKYVLGDLGTKVIFKKHNISTFLKSMTHVVSE